MCFFVGCWLLWSFALAIYHLILFGYCCLYLVSFACMNLAQNIVLQSSGTSTGDEVERLKVCCFTMLVYSSVGFVSKSCFIEIDWHYLSDTFLAGGYCGTFPVGGCEFWTPNKQWEVISDSSSAWAFYSELEFVVHWWCLEIQGIIIDVDRRWCLRIIDRWCLEETRIIINASMVNF